jgi:hypothetical protein
MVSKLLWEIESLSQSNIEFELILKNWFLVEYKNQEKIETKISQLYDKIKGLMHHLSLFMNVEKNPKQKTEFYNFQINTNQTLMNLSNVISSFKEKSIDEMNSLRPEDLTILVDPSNHQYANEIITSLDNLYTKLNVLNMKSNYISQKTSKLNTFCAFLNETVKQLSTPLIHKIVSKSNLFDLTKSFYNLKQMGYMNTIVLSEQVIGNCDPFESGLESELMQVVQLIQSQVKDYGKKKSLLIKRFIKGSYSQN